MQKTDIDNQHALVNIHRVIYLYIYIHRVPKKVSHLMFDNNFGKYGPIFKRLTLR